MDTSENKEKTPAESPNRRDMLKGIAAMAGLLAAAGCETLSSPAVEAFLQQHFKEMSQAELSGVLNRLSKQYSEKYGKTVSVNASPPYEGVSFAYALDISRCIGCRRCVYGCIAENNQSRTPPVHWITVLEMDKEKGVDLQHADAYYEAEKVPREGHFYFPTACQQCSRPPCVKVCPVGATWKEKDGIVVIDYDWCIGCRCCMSACPYGARHFNWTTPEIPAEEMNENTEYLGNRPRPKGVVEKCTFCIQRTRKGMYPKCVEVCPVGARKFGNLLDPSSEIRYILENKRVFIFKEDLNTGPNFFYYFGIGGRRG
ncbi:MAG TPA: 4Fe-4S dicluster domain-containing protein [Planctomycetota bacterium]|jgi:molybdopterin-containing oxidoreductase family iron-sulfur binding subunit